MVFLALQIILVLTACFLLAYTARHCVFTVAALYSLKKRKSNPTFSYQPTVSILIPALNEENVLPRLLHAVTRLDYPKDKLEVVVIDDGSTDGTGTIADEFAAEYGYVKVVHRSPREGRKGKASALNAGLKASSGEFIFCFDADYYPPKDILHKLVEPFSNPKIGAVQGRVTVLNEPKNLVTRIVALERIGGYRVDQYAREKLGLIPQFGGTVGGFRRKVLEALGGWDEEMLAEDTELTFRLYLEGYKIRYVDDAECYEEAVETWGAYWRQRYRWAYGHMQTAFRYLGKLLKSDKLAAKEKVDGFLLLCVYFVPIIVLASWLLSGFLYFSSFEGVFGVSFAIIAISVYSAVGNFAPFFEVGIGAYLDKRTRAYWLVPMFLFTFLYNILICTKAFTDLLLTKIFRKRRVNWAKTTHSGNGNSYIQN